MCRYIFRDTVLCLLVVSVSDVIMFCFTALLQLVVKPPPQRRMVLMANPLLPQVEWNSDALLHFTVNVNVSHVPLDNL